MAIEGEMGCKQGCLLFATSDTRTKLANKEVKRPHSPNTDIYTQRTILTGSQKDSECKLRAKFHKYTTTLVRKEKQEKLLPKFLRHIWWNRL